MHAGEQGAVLVMVDAALEHRARIQMNTSDHVIKHMRKTMGSGAKKMSVAQSVSFRLNESYFASVGMDCSVPPSSTL